MELAERRSGKQRRPAAAAFGALRASIPRAMQPKLPARYTASMQLFYVTPKDRPHVSRAVPLAAAAVDEAVRDAALDTKHMSREELREIAVLVGSGGASQEFTEQQYRFFYEGKQKQCSVYVIPTSTPGTLASEVSMRFGFRGFSHLISTGCTSSTDALGYALRTIRYGHASRVVAGGVDAPIAPLIVRGFQLMRIMSTRWNDEPGRASRPFSTRPRRLRHCGGSLVLRVGDSASRHGARRENLRRDLR